KRKGRTACPPFSQVLGLASIAAAPPRLPYSCATLCCEPRIANGNSSVALTDVNICRAEELAEHESRDQRALTRSHLSFHHRSGGAFLIKIESLDLAAPQKLHAKRGPKEYGKGSQ